MKYKQMGSTGLFVSEICLGAMTFGGDPDTQAFRGMGYMTQDQVDAVVARALGAGVNFIDTADTYFQGQSERMVGQALRNLGRSRKDVVISTKTSGIVGHGPNDRGASRGHIMDAVKLSLERLQTDYIDLYQIHQTDSVTPLDETLRALDDLRAQGLIRYFGASNWHAWRIAMALGTSEAKNYGRLETIQAYYSIAGRDIEREIVPLLEAQKLGLLVWSPLAGGLLSGKFGPGTQTPEDSRRASFDFPPVNTDRAWPIVAAMREIGDARGVSVARVALAWVLAKRYVMSVIIGAKNTDQLNDNLAAVDLALLPEETQRLDKVSAPELEYPGWMLAFLGDSRVPMPFEP
ncbi:MAG: aldo/keto reductase [Sphingobium sp.]|uniref:aldo/keto reductase n=1 Tax=Sphingobium sp. CECT 9361 TaxID=2845384 RepID=UPI001E3EC6C0|nr:aldo/keto reductase [Sphingobium sp. CECT 9361]CAH0357046.1 1-deoxyxylulose-5-phosphate synthase YajO [Sphingobium sp. CECT 9361]